MTDLPSEQTGIRSCRGEPLNVHFFKKTPYRYENHMFERQRTKYMYLDRHKVLFNLYAFDSMRSNRTHAPTLNLVNCDFKYYVDDI